MSRSYMHHTCSTCGLRATNNGMGRDAHEHSKVHINALKARASDATGARKAELEREVAKLEAELDDRKARRLARMERQRGKVVE